MNKIHSFAKVILSAMGLFFAIRIIVQIPTPIWFFTMNPSLKSLGIAIASVSIAGLCLVVVCYLFLYKREQLAKRIVGKEESIEPALQIQWLPVAFRLICITAGLYCLYIVGWQIIFKLGQYSMYQRQARIYALKVINIEDVLCWMIMLAIGIYLVIGAPHFARWHVKKTLQFATEEPSRVEPESNPL